MLAVAAYPFLIYGGLSVVEPRTLSVIVGAALILRGARSTARRCTTTASPLALPVAGVAPVLVLAALLNEKRVLLLVPSLINAALLLAFGWTLWQGPSMVEVFARTQGRVSAEAAVYCRAVTGVWCLFFVLNGGIALWLALYASVARWTFYTGFMAYVLIGLLFVGEFAYRHWRFRGLRGMTADRTLRGGS